jgi:hypothetical protein
MRTSEEFYTKADKPVKAVIRNLSGSTSSEDITVVLQELDYDVISVKQMTTKRPTPEGGVTHLRPPLPSYAGKESTSSRNRPVDITLLYTRSYKGRGV